MTLFVIVSFDSKGALLETMARSMPAVCYTQPTRNVTQTFLKRGQVVGNDDLFYLSVSFELLGTDRNRDCRECNRFFLAKRESPETGRVVGNSVAFYLR